MILMDILTDWMPEYSFKVAFPCALTVIPNAQAGFFLVQYAQFWQEHLDKLMDLYSSGKLKVNILVALAKHT